MFEEGLTRSAPAFARFFEALSFSHGELVNYSNVARDCGVTSKTVKEYFQILVDTLMGVLVEPFGRRRSRAVITKAPKFYLFDVGVAGHVTGRRIGRAAGPDFGRALENFVLMEILAYRSYRERDFPVRFWRTRSGLECDFVLGRDGDVAIEVKGSGRVGRRELRGVRAFVDEHGPRHAMVVCNESVPRRTEDGIRILPWERFFGGGCGGAGWCEGWGGARPMESVESAPKWALVVQQPESGPFRYGAVPAGWRTYSYPIILPAS